MAKPTELPTWATGAGAAKTDPGAAKKLLGWIVEKVPHQWLNYWMNLVYQWLAHLENSPPGYDDLGDAADDLAASRAAGADDPLIAMVRENTDVSSLGNVSTDYLWRYAGDTTAVVRNVATDGHYVIMSEDTELTLHNRKTGALIDTYSAPSNITSIAMDREDVVITEGNNARILVYGASGFSSLRSYTGHGAALNCCSIIGDKILVGGTLNGGISARRLSRVDGSSLADNSLWAGGNVFAVLAQMSGNHYVAETTTLHRVNDSLSSQHTYARGVGTIYSLIRTKDAVVLGGVPNAAGKEVEACALGTLAVLWDLDHGANLGGNDLAYDGQAVYVHSSASGTGLGTNDLPGNLRAIDPVSGQTLWTADNSGSNSNGIAADHGSIFIGYDNGTQTLARCRTLNKGGLAQFAKVDQFKELPFQMIPLDMR